MSETTDRPGIPASMRQKRILDAASEHPDAAIDTLAEKIPGVSVDVVERVLEDYGDPADTPPTEPATTDDAPELLPEAPTLSELTDCQIETLRTIVAHPDATQQKLGELLDVSAPTICTRVNNLPRFEWDDRYQYATTVLDSNAAQEADQPMMQSSTDLALDHEEDHVSRRIETLEGRLDALEAGSNSRLDLDPELIQKVLHVCLHSDSITDAEELKILRAFIE